MLFECLFAVYGPHVHFQSAILGLLQPGGIFLEYRVVVIDAGEAHFLDFLGGNVSVEESYFGGRLKFVQTLAAKGVKVVISTRADIEKVRPAFEGLLGENVVLHQETSATYGSVKWDAWRRACAMNKLRNFSTLAVTGSGFGVKSALVAGMGSVAVTSPHVAYQDFGGADEVVTELNASTAKSVLEILRV